MSIESKRRMSCAEQKLRRVVATQQVGRNKRIALCHSGNNYFLSSRKPRLSEAIRDPGKKLLR